MFTHMKLRSETSLLDRAYAVLFKCIRCLVDLSEGGL